MKKLNKEKQSDALYRKQHWFAIRLKNQMYKRLPHVKARARGTRNAYLKEYYKNNREKLIKRSFEWAKANREKKRLHQRRYKEKLKMLRQQSKDKNSVQYLDNSFWQLCERRSIYQLPQLLYVYLRGRYCKYGPEFEWSDVELRKLLGVGKNTLIRARKYLQERGLILFRSGKGRQVTHYTMLASVLLPISRGSKLEPQKFKFDRFTIAQLRGKSERSFCPAKIEP